MQKKTCRSILAFALSFAMAFGLMAPTRAFAETKAEPEATQEAVRTPVDLTTSGLTDDLEDSNHLGNHGYFYANLTGENEGRQVQVYLPANANIRPYYLFIAIPDGVDAAQFLESAGWFDIADETGEGLFVLMPGEGGWGSYEQEISYMNAAKALHSGSGKYFTTFGEFYLVGYGAGAAPLEAWAAANPHWIIGQTYIDGQSYGAEQLAAIGAGFYDYKSQTDGDNKVRTKDGMAPVNTRLTEDGEVKIMYQMTERLKDVIHPDTDHAGLLEKDDFVLPTWYINSDETASFDYWKMVNKANAAGEVVAEFGCIPVTGQEFNQQEDAWATSYAGHISKAVNIKTDVDVCTYEVSRSVRDEMAVYTRYDNSLPYGNGLTYRLDFSEISVAQKTSPDHKAIGKVSGRTLDGTLVEGEISIQLMKLDSGETTDLILYVPETAGDKDIPVMVVLHGGTQTSSLFFDSTDWWQTAAQEGFALALSTRTANVARLADSMAVGVFDKTYEVLGQDGRFDMSRFYCTGQSAGASSAIMIGDESCDRLAAYAASSASNFMEGENSGFLPVSWFTGEGNYAKRGIPGYTNDTSYPEWDILENTRSSEAIAAGADVYWDPELNMQQWIDYYLHKDGLTMDDLSDTINYFEANALYGESWNGPGTIADWQTNNARLRQFNWLNKDGIAIMQYNFGLFQAHNCQPYYRQYMWDFCKHFSIDVASQTRYYSESAFAEDDAVVIYKEGPLGEAQELGETVPVVNNSPEVSPLVIPYTGYFNGTVQVGDATRTYKLYIPEGFRMKTYQIVLNVPDDVDTAEFLVESGWKAVADKEQIMLRVLEPGEAGWSMDDLAYIKAALGSNNSITTFAYVVGYGVGGSVLQKYTMADAANYGACAFVDASAGIDAEYMASMATMNYKCNPSRSDSPDSYAYDELPMPIWFVESDGISEDEQAVIDYWKKPGDIQGEGVAFYDGQIYSQGEAYNYLTPISNVNKMAITADPANATPENIYAFLKNFIRYGGTSLGSNSLFTRPDYKALGVVEDYVICDDIRRDYIVYVPESVDTSKEAPVVFTLHGSGSGHYMEFDASDWWEIADKNGLIVVSVNGTITATSVKTGSTPGIGWPGAGDGRVFRAIIAQMEENGYKMDHKRLYAHGQSAGGRGVAGMVIDDPTLFAAAGTTTNASIFDIPVGTDSSNYPGLFSLVGEYDNSNNQFTLEEGTEENPSLLAKILWSRGITWKFGTNNGNVKHPDEIIKNATYTEYRWKNAAGKTLYEFAVVENRGHSMKADNCWKVWEEFSKYTRDDEGNLLENGERVFVETKVEPQKQIVVMNTTAITKTYGDKAFTLKAKTTGDGQLTYKSSDTKVVKVDKNGKVTIKGTGKAVITITAAATENYKAATLKVTIKVVPKKAAIASAKVSKKNLTVKVKKDTKASGYQVQVSTSVNFAKKSTCQVTTAKNSKVTATVKNLKLGTYYVRTRAYKTVGSSKYYGAYSAVKVVVVK